MKTGFGLLGFSLCLFAWPALAQAPDPAYVKQIVASVKKKYPDLTQYCALPTDERKQTVVTATIELAIAAKGRLTNPMESGLEAGNQIAKECGTETSGTSVADLMTTDPAVLTAAASKAADLKFPAEVTRYSSGAYTKMAMFKPEGSGPFPAIALVHQCAGLSSSMIQWVYHATVRGYVALLIDSFGPRNVKSVCYGPEGGITYERGAKDAFQAADHLRSLPFVDKDRIAIAGYSWGAGVAAMTSSKLINETLNATQKRFAAAVAFYPGCFPVLGTARPDIDKPLLVLMGDADTETPPKDCVDAWTPAKASGAPVEWTIYSGATHCWDCQQLDGLSKTDIRGVRVDYKYSESFTRESVERMFEFLAKAMAKT